MADRVFFVAGSPEDFFRVSLPEEMVRALQEVAKLTPETLDEVATALEDVVGFLDESRLKQLIRDSIAEDNALEAVVEVILNLRPASVGQTIARLRSWREADSRRAERLSDVSMSAIEANLPRLIRDFPALERFRKAKRLLSLTGNQARQIDIICDARPVFDSDQRVIEGFVTQTILRVGYETQTEEAGCIELVLSPVQLKDFLEKVEKAQRKVYLLRKLIGTSTPHGLAESDDITEQEAMR